MKFELDAEIRVGHSVDLYVDNYQDTLLNSREEHMLVEIEMESCAHGNCVLTAASITRSVYSFWNVFRHLDNGCAILQFPRPRASK